MTGRSVPPPGVTRQRRAVSVVAWARTVNPSFATTTTQTTSMTMATATQLISMTTWSTGGAGRETPRRTLGERQRNAGSGPPTRSRRGLPPQMVAAMTTGMASQVPREPAAVASEECGADGERGIATGPRPRPRRRCAVRCA